MSITFEVSKVALPKGPMATIAREAALPRLLGAGERAKHRVISLDGTESEVSWIFEPEGPSSTIRVGLRLDHGYDNSNPPRRIWCDQRILVGDPQHILIPDNAAA